MLNGKHYNRAVRSHKIVLEALIRRSWVSFYQWLDKDREEFSQDEVIRSIRCLCDSCNQTNADSMLHSDDFQILFALYGKFLKDCRTSNGPVSAFWLSYIDIILLLLRFIRSTRQSDWNLHLACIQQILPWMFAYDCSNYSRYLTFYFCQMKMLPETHPEVHDQLIKGGFAVQRAEGSKFRKVAVDHCIEQTFNRDTKTRGASLDSVLKKVL